jgi:NADPH-dependent curcumin reductase CurA
MEGFLVFDYLPRAAEAQAAIRQWMSEGRFKNRVDVVEGLENAPDALARLFKGENRGKQLVRVAEPA